MLKAALYLSGKVVLLTIVLFVCFAISATIISQPEAPNAPEQSGAAAKLLLVSFLNTVVITYIILRSRWGGWRLIGTIFLVYYGVTTFMSQIESAVFITNLPSGFLPRLFVMGALIAAPFSILSVLILGRRKPDPLSRLVMPANAWAWKITVIVLAYLLLYFTFGYFIAWRNPAVLAYYNGVDEGSFLAHMGVVVSESPWLIPFQALRGLLWIGLALPVIRMMKGRVWETALAIGLLFAVVMNTQLLLPNPYMPEAVRYAHLIETATSNLIFGLLVGGLLAHNEPRAAHSPSATAPSTPTSA